MMKIMKKLSNQFSNQNTYAQKVLQIVLMMFILLFFLPISEAAILTGNEPRCNTVCTADKLCNLITGKCEVPTGLGAPKFNCQNNLYADCIYAGFYCKIKTIGAGPGGVPSYIYSCENGCDNDNDCTTTQTCDINTKTCNEKPAGPVICTDSDIKASNDDNSLINQIKYVNYNQKGTVTITDDIPRTDVCIGEKLTEYYCEKTDNPITGNSEWTWDSKTITCPAGYSCNLGACTIACTDTDTIAQNDDNSFISVNKFVNYDLKGTATGIKFGTDNQIISTVDSCSADGKLIEAFCQNVLSFKVNTKTVSCQAGKICKQGACVTELQNTCTDSDNGKDYSIKGIITFNGKTTDEDEMLLEDACHQTNPNQLVEYYCDVNAQGKPMYKTENHDCAAGEICNDGSCKKPEFTGIEVKCAKTIQKPDAQVMDYEVCKEDKDCDFAGYLCNSNNKCATGCNNNKDCQSNNVCNENTNTCILQTSQEIAAQELTAEFGYEYSEKQPITAGDNTELKTSPIGNYDNSNYIWTFGGNGNTPPLIIKSKDAVFTTKRTDYPNNITLTINKNGQTKRITKQANILCTADDYCKSAYSCSLETGKCEKDYTTQKSCTKTTDCELMGYYCKNSNNKCTSGCDENIDCKSGNACNIIAHQCVTTTPKPCSKLDDCTDNTVCNFNTKKCETKNAAVITCSGFNTNACKYAGTYCKIPAAVNTKYCESGCNDNDDCNAGDICDTTNHLCQNICKNEADGYITTDGKNKDILCKNKIANICFDATGYSYKKSYGTVIDTGTFDVLCAKNGVYNTWYESNPDGNIEKTGNNGLTKSAGTIINAGDCNYISANYVAGGKTYESWIGCNCKVGPNGVKANAGKKYNGYECNNYDKWVKIPGDNDYTAYAEPKKGIIYALMGKNVKSVRFNENTVTDVILDNPNVGTSSYSDSAQLTELGINQLCDNLFCGYIDIDVEVQFSPKDKPITFEQQTLTNDNCYSYTKGIASSNQNCNKAVAISGNTDSYCAKDSSYKCLNGFSCINNRCVAISDTEAQGSTYCTKQSDCQSTLSCNLNTHKCEDKITGTTCSTEQNCYYTGTYCKLNTVVENPSCQSGCDNDNDCKNYQKCNTDSNPPICTDKTPAATADFTIEESTNGNKITIRTFPISKQYYAASYTWLVGSITSNSKFGEFNLNKNEFPIEITLTLTVDGNIRQSTQEVNVNCDSAVYCKSGYACDFTSNNCKIIPEPLPACSGAKIECPLSDHCIQLNSTTKQFECYAKNQVIEYDYPTANGVEKRDIVCSNKNTWCVKGFINVNGICISGQTACFKLPYDKNCGSDTQLTKGWFLDKNPNGELACFSKKNQITDQACCLSQTINNIDYYLDSDIKIY